MGKKKGGTRGAFARNHPRSIRDRFDMDYWHKLSQEEREFYAQAMDEGISGDFSYADPFITDKEKRREIYRLKNAANRDIWGAGLRDSPGAPDTEEPGTTGMYDGPDYSPTPEYLSSQEYKAALAEVRKHLGPNDKTKPKDSPALRKAYAALRGLRRVSDD